jgi:hypothetical protein
MVYLQNLLDYLELDIDEEKEGYTKIEKEINNYFYNNFSLLYNYNIQYLDYKTLRIFNDKNFLKLCKYFIYINRYDKIIKNNTQFNIVYKKEDTFLIFLFTKNFINYMNYNPYHKYPENIFYNIDDSNISFINKEIDKGRLIKKKYKTDINYSNEFKILCEKIVLFISLTNCELYNNYIIPFDLIIYMLLGHQKFTHLFY